MTTLPTPLRKPQAGPFQFGLDRAAVRIDWLVLGGLILLGAGLRLVFLGDKSLWLDEAFSVALSQHNPGEIIRSTVLTDTHPPLYYLLLSLWTLGGTGESHIRLLSALFSIASIPIIYLLGTILFKHTRAGLIAAAVLAFSPFQIWYAQEARMYAMLTFLLLASACFFVLALHRRSPMMWGGFVMATALALFTDNGALWYVLALGLFYLSSFRHFPGTFRGWVVSQVGLGLLYLPWLPFLAHQTRQVTQNFWLTPPTFQTVLNTFLDFNSLNFPWMAVSVLYMAVIFVWAYIVPNNQNWQRTLATLMLAAPLIASLLFSLRQPIFLSRNLIAASLGFYLLIAGTIWQFTDTRAIAALLLPLMLMNMISVGHNLWREPKEDWRGAAAYVAESARQADNRLIIFIPGYAELPFQYYFEQYSLPADTQGYPANEVLLHSQAQPAGDVAALLSDRPYVWLVLRDAEAVDPKWTVKAWLDSHGYMRASDYVRDDFSIITYVRWDRLRWRTTQIPITYQATP